MKPMPTDQQLADYMALKEQVKIALAKIKYINDLCKNHGSFCSDRFVCSVYEQEQRRLVGLEEVASALGWDKLDEYDLIKVISFCIVKVTERKLDEIG